MSPRPLDCKVQCLPSSAAAVVVLIIFAGGVVGYWWWTWGGTNYAPGGSNLGELAVDLPTRCCCPLTVPPAGVAFSGWADINNALSESSQIQWRLPGARFLSVGGGNTNGRFTAGNLRATTDAIYAGRLSSYQGIVYDIEEGEGGLEQLFRDSFRAAKSRGLQVLVTVSHSAPYGVPGADSLMRSFFSNGDIDYLSPQLYTSGEEGGNDFSTLAGVQWWEYGQARAAVIPSVVDGWMYGDAQGYFSTQGVNTQGYVQWRQLR